MTDLLRVAQYSSQSKDLQKTVVNVYLRLADSKAMKVQLGLEESVAELSLKIEGVVGVKARLQILYYKGRELALGATVHLTDKSIIHIKVRQELTEEATINIVRHLPQDRNIFKLNFETVSVQVNMHHTIADFLKHCISASE